MERRCFAAKQRGPPLIRHHGGGVRPTASYNIQIENYIPRKPESGIKGTTPP